MGLGHCSELDLLRPGQHVNGNHIRKKSVSVMILLCIFIKETVGMIQAMHLPSSSVVMDVVVSRKVLYVPIGEPTSQDPLYMHNAKMLRIRNPNQT
jgi:hypothetical protein